jgi:transposase
MEKLAKIGLAQVLYEQGMNKRAIGVHVGVHRETVGMWLAGIEAQGLAGFMESYSQAKKGPRRKRQTEGWVKEKIFEIRAREHDCCGEKIGYFLAQEFGIEISVSKIYEILGERLQLRSKWKKNQPRGYCPDAQAPREVVQMDSIDFGKVFAFTAVDIHSKEADIALAPKLTAAEGYRFLQTSMQRRFDGYVQIIQTDGGSEFEAEFAQHVRQFCLHHRLSRPYKKNEQAFIESFNRTVRKECLGWEKYTPEQIPKLTEQVERFLYRYHYHRPHLGLVPLRPPL